MDSLQSLQSDRRHKDDIVPPARSAAPVTARLGWGSADPESPQQVDVAAEETCPAPAAQMSGEESHLAPPIQPPPGPSEKTLELINQLDALAGDLAASGHSSSDQFVEKVHDEPNFSGEARVVEPSIRVSPRPNFEKDPFASDRPLIARRTIFTLVGCCAAALIGVALASQSHRVWTTNASSELQAAAPQERPSLVGQTSASIAAPPSVPVAQTASAAAGRCPRAPPTGCWRWQPGALPIGTVGNTNRDSTGRPIRRTPCYSNRDHGHRAHRSRDNPTPNLCSHSICRSSR